LNAAAMNAKMTDVQNFYQTLPHTSVSADVASVAAHMSSVDGFKNVTISPGGIGATFSDGTPAFIFTDREEDLEGSSTASGARQAAMRQRLDEGASPSPSSTPTDPPPYTTLGPGAPHVVAFLINTGDRQAFTPAHQFELGSEFVGDGFTAANGYEVDVLNVTLENITGLGASHPLDLFSISTHGAVDLNPEPRYTWLSQTAVTDTSLQTYASDIAQDRVLVSVYLGIGQSIQLATFAFTPAFLTEHVQFNPGAIVDNQACFGQSPTVAPAVNAALQAAGAGRYYAWTKGVGGKDSDSFEIFLYDRLIGVGSQAMVQSGLEQIVFRNFLANAAPQQRPFPLDAIDTVAYTEERFRSLGDSPGTLPFSVSDDGDAYNAAFAPLSDGTASKLVISDFGGESVANPPIEYALPSIRDLQVNEFQGGGALEIDGNFPATRGTVSIVNDAGTYSPTINSWSTTKIVTTIPDTGAGAYGAVTVTDAGITSNAVPLTQWSGAFTYNETDTIPAIAANHGVTSDGVWALAGTGSGSAQATFTIGLRADVHPIAPSIDTAAAHQNLIFSTFEGGSNAVFTAASGSFTASGGGYGTQNFALRTAIDPILSPPYESDPFFTLVPVSPGTGCNSGSAGVGQSNAGVFCPGFELYGGLGIVLRCTTTGEGTPPNQAIGDPCEGDPVSGGISIPASPADTLMFSLDPSSYALTLTGNLAPYPQQLYGGGNVSFYDSTFNQGYARGTATPSITSVVMQPVSPPQAMTPDFRSRLP
jgi:hypothetical protein